MLNPVAARKGQRTRINPAIFQQHLESASNAGQKGQAQWHTPAAWAAALAGALPVYRPVIVDFNCGIGSFLRNAAGKSTNYLLGSDIEGLPGGGEESMLTGDFVQADITKFYPLLHAVKWTADLFVLNPPWDLHWYRSNLALLAKSDCLAVQSAFAAHDGRTTKDTIDSTMATLCLALDRSSPVGEGVLVANDASLERLIFAPNAPHRALAAHVWARASFPGNICDQRDAGPNFSKGGHSGTEFKTGVIWWARSHTGGSRGIIYGQADQVAAQLFKQRPSFRKGAEIKPWDGLHTTDTAELWRAAKEEWSSMTATNATASRWNIYLDADGSLKTNLSLFETSAGKVKKSEADRLFQLNGRLPMQLVVQRTERRALEEAVFGRDGKPSPWKVAPVVIAAVQDAIAEYNAVRAPLAPLSKIQRLGYLDEQEEVKCVKELRVAGRIYLAGQSYPLRTETLRVNRSGEKMNNEGSLDEVEYDSSELALWVGEPGGRAQAPGGEALVMEARLKNDPNTRLSIQEEGAPSPITFTLQQFVEHFAIPEVPDVAELNPAGFQHHLELLGQIEQIANAKEAHV